MTLNPKSQAVLKVEPLNHTSCQFVEYYILHNQFAVETAGSWGLETKSFIENRIDFSFGSF